jgi:branched-chain amino acid transport system substrate-binding protein
MKINPKFLSLALLASLLLVPVSAFASPVVPNQPLSKVDCKDGGWQNFANAGFRNQGDCVSFVETGQFVCRDSLGCMRYAEGDQIKLATALATSGIVANLGIDELRGVEIALDFHGDLFGHDIGLINEDTMCTSEGSEMAANTIVANPDIAAVVGTTCSSAALTAAPIISSAGYTIVSPSNTSPILTDPGVHEAGYLRVSWNDRNQAIVIAEFVKNHSATTSAVIVDGDLYSTNLGETFVGTFEARNGTNLTFEVADPNGSDAAGAINAIISAEIPDLLYLPVLEPLASALVIEARATPALDGTQLVGIQGVVSREFIDTAGDAAEDMLFTAYDLSFTDSSGYATFSTAYFNKFHEYPKTYYSAFSFDATNVILDAIEKAGVIDADNTLYVGRQALRDALFSTYGYDGLTGSITCNSLGDCAAVGFDILTVNEGELVPAP